MDMKLHASRGGESGALAPGAAAHGRPRFGHAEIAELAYRYWQWDGCPPGRDLQYWLEAETQLRATRDLLTVACDASVAAELLSEVFLTDLAVALGDRLLS